MQYVTGHGRDGRLPADIDWASLADPAATTVVYMPEKTLAELAARAIAHGLPPDTPAVAVARRDPAGRDGDRRRPSPICRRLGDAAADGPVLVLIGRVFADVGTQAQQTNVAHASRAAISEVGNSGFAVAATFQFRSIAEMCQYT